MPRVYKPVQGGKQKKYDENELNNAVQEYLTSNLSLSAVSKKYGINKSVLYRHATKVPKKPGGQTVLSAEAELAIIKYINVCAEWGYPLDALDLRYIVKMYLEKSGIKQTRFKNNMPGPDFVNSFLSRHKDKITQRICQNIKRTRAAVSPDTIKSYFEELRTSIADVPIENILNYDETNLADDPGRRKIITRRGTKYPERVLNHSKAAVSVMMAGTADGQLLPPYVVYKAQHLYNTWVEHGPKGARFNRTASGWFDGVIFEDWIRTIVIPFFSQKEGKKILIGDNLSSHLSIDMIKLCQEQNISFVFLPPNSTHLAQPLDVAFFHPLKVAWRKILLQWKRSDGRQESCVLKGCFPKLLKLLMNEIEESAPDNLRAAFRKTGISPLNPDVVLARLPDETVDSNRYKDAVDESVLKLLSEMRYGTMSVKEPSRKRKLEVVPGKSVGENYVKDMEAPSTSACVTRQTKQEKGRQSKQENREEGNTNEKHTGKGSKKGKGVGKKTVNKTETKQLRRLSEDNIDISSSQMTEILVDKSENSSQQLIDDDFKENLVENYVEDMEAPSTSACVTRQTKQEKGRQSKQENREEGNTNEKHTGKGSKKGKGVGKKTVNKTETKQLKRLSEDNIGISSSQMTGIIVDNSENSNQQLIGDNFKENSVLVSDGQSEYFKPTNETIEVPLDIDKLSFYCQDSFLIEEIVYNNRDLIDCVNFEDVVDRSIKVTNQEVKKRKIEITSDTILNFDKNYLTQNMTKISPQTKIPLQKPKVPKTITKKRPSYYRNEQDILKDLMNDDVI